ncbi:MAG: hypothetical protein Q4F83_08645 [Eubacteriales bacterium]|nr:hypothetical protein [Eubacteriales bacterium]
MKRWVAAVILTAMILGGCRARELEEREFVQALELDLREGKIAGGFGEYMISGDTVEEIIIASQNRMDRYLDLGHIKVIVLGKELFQEKKRLRQALEELEKQPLIARSSRIFIYDYGEEESYLRQIADEGKEPGEYLCDLYKNNPYRSSSTMTLEELLREEL